MNGSSDLELPRWVKRGREERSLVIWGRTKPWKGGTPRRGQSQVPQPLLCLSKKCAVEAENWGELTRTGRRSWGPQQSGKDKTVFIGTWSKAASVCFNQRGILLSSISFLIFSFLLNSGGHCNPQLLYFQSCPCCRLRTGVIYC